MIDIKPVLSKRFRRGGRGPTHYDCGGVAEYVWAAAGLCDQGRVFMPAWNSKSCTMDTVTEAFEAMGEFFEVIGHHHIMATRVGDFVVIECPDGHAHVYTLIDPEERYFLTAERVRGVVVATPIEIEAQGTTLSVHRIRR